MQPPVTQQIPLAIPLPTPLQSTLPTHLQSTLPTPLQSTQQTVHTTVQTTPQTTPQQPSSDDQDPAECYAKRRLRALQLTGVVFALSLVVFMVGLACATLTDNIAVSGYYSGVIMTFGAFLGLVGMHLQENRRHMLRGAIIFISLGVIAAFFCAIVDGIIAGEWIDSRPLLEGSCQFYSSSLGYVYNTYYTEITCPSTQSSGCKLRVKSNTCYCCYRCDSVNYSDQYHLFEGVTGCWDVVHLHRLLWVSVVLNVLAVCLGVINAALLGAYKDLPNPSLHAPPGTAPPGTAPPGTAPPLPHMLYNPTQHMMTYPLQPYPSHQLMHTPQYHPEGRHAADQSRGPGLPPPHPPTQPHPPAPPHPAPTQPHPEDGGQHDLYALTQDASVLYAAAYPPFVKPPPYAY